MDKSKEKIILGADHAGFRLKQWLLEQLQAQGYSVEDIGCFDETSVDYPDISRKLAEAMQTSTSPARGLLCCGSGIGVCIAANRFPWIRAVEAHDHNTAVMSRRHNDTNVLSFGGRVIAPELALDILNTWLDTAFEGGRHQKRVDLMSKIHDGVSSC